MDRNHYIEMACRAWYDSKLECGQYGWDELVKLDDRRLRGWRNQMEAALDAVGFFEFAYHAPGGEDEEV